MHIFMEMTFLSVFDVARKDKHGGGGVTLCVIFVFHFLYKCHRLMRADQP